TTSLIDPSSNIILGLYPPDLIQCESLNFTNRVDTSFLEKNKSRTATYDEIKSGGLYKTPKKLLTSKESLNNEYKKNYTTSQKNERFIVNNIKNEDEEEDNKFDNKNDKFIYINRN